MPRHPVRAGPGRAGATTTGSVDLLTLGLHFLHEGASCAGQHPAEVDGLLDVNVLVLRAGEDFVSVPMNQVLTIVALFGRLESLKKRQDMLPFDVVASRMLEQLQQESRSILVEMR